MTDPRLEVKERDLGGCWVEAYYLETRTGRHMAVQAGLPPLRVRLYGLAARGLGRVPRAEQRLLARENEKFKGGAGAGAFVFCVPRDSSDASTLLVRAVSEVLRETEPGWVSAVEEVRASTDDPDAVAFWSGAPIEAVLAARSTKNRS